MLPDAAVVHLICRSVDFGLFTSVLVIELVHVIILVCQMAVMNKQIRVFRGERQLTRHENECDSSCVLP